MSATANYTKLGQITYQAEVRYSDGDYPSVHHPALPQPQEFPGKAAQLQDATSGLARVTRQTREQVSAGGPRPRTELVRTAVAYHGRHYRAGRLLHPDQPTPRGGERP